MKADHVVLDGNTFLCRHCQQTYRPTLPAPVTMYVGMMKVFVQQHRACRKPEPPKGDA